MGDIESLSATSTAAANEPDNAPEEKATQPTALGGHKEIAEVMANWPVNAIFRRFGCLNLLNLLYYQAELARLERRLRIISKKDSNSGDRFRERYRMDFDNLAQGTTENGINTQQWDLILKIRQLLKEYSLYFVGLMSFPADKVIDEAVIQNGQILRLDSPQSADLRTLVMWMNNNGNDQYTNLDSADYDLWSVTEIHELVSLRAREHADPISSWLWGSALDRYHKLFGRFVTKVGFLVVGLPC